MNTSQLLHFAARSYGDRPAISSGDEVKFSYSQMSQRVAALAGGILKRFDLNHGDRVVIAMSNRATYFEVLFGVWHAGLSAVPVNAKLHSKEIEYIATDAGAKLAFVSSDLPNELALAIEGLDTIQQVIDTDSSDYEKLLDEPISAKNADRDDLAWLFYTSGTTGKPKGAKLTHQNLQLMAWSYICDIVPLTESDALLLLGPQSHAAGLIGLSYIAKGANNVLPPSGTFNEDEVLDLVNRVPNLTFFVVPSMLRRILDSSRVSACNMGNIRTIIGGAAPFSAPDIRRTLNVFGEKFTNGYGQGECPCTISAMPQRAYSADLSDVEIVSVGVPRTGTEVCVVDESFSELPPGEIGEIVVRSDIVMQGYWNAPEKTAQALRNDWLLTGDCGAFDHRGRLYLKDRSKDVIISGGTNIYPGEIEAILIEHPLVAEVAVVGAPDTEWGETPIAFVVPESDTNIDTKDLDEACLANLARFKRPKHYEFVTELPRNSIGKVLKTELRKKFEAQ